MVNDNNTIIGLPINKKPVDIKKEKNVEIKEMELTPENVEKVLREQIKYYNGTNKKVIRLTITKLASLFWLSFNDFRNYCLTTTMEDKGDILQKLFNILLKLQVEDNMEKSIEKGAISKPVESYLKDSLQALEAGGFNQVINIIEYIPSTHFKADLKMDKTKGETNDAKDYFKDILKES